MPQAENRAPLQQWGAALGHRWPSPTSTSFPIILEMEESVLHLHHVLLIKADTERNKKKGTQEKISISTNDELLIKKQLG
jgi:hypothetical protein